MSLTTCLFNWKFRRSWSRFLSPLSILNETLLLFGAVFTLRKHHLHVFNFKWVSVDSWLNTLLLLSSSYNPLFHRTTSNKSVNRNLLSLTDTMSSVCCLLIHRRVPIVVVEYYRISRNKIDSKSTSSGRKKERKYVWVVLILVHHESSIL